MRYLQNVHNRKRTPQSEPIPGTKQVKNSAGGYTFAVNDWTRLERFLVLGTEGGSYYATERALTRDSAQVVLRCLQADGPRVVRQILAVSEAGRAPKNDPAIFALALAVSAEEMATRQAALTALPRICRIGTHLFHFAAFVDGMRGWGRGLRRAVGEWYQQMPVGSLAYQAVKYQQRDGWGHRDLLRLSHPRPRTEKQRTLYHWITQGWPDVGNEAHPDADLRLIWAFERAKRAETAGEVAALIREQALPREAVPTEFLGEVAVWQALLDSGMPMTALIRNLATMTRVGIFADKERVRQVVEQLTNGERLRKARVHPIAVLSALKTYAQGHGERGNATWTPVTALVDALDSAFYTAFGSLESTGRRWVLALDVSGSMGGGRLAGVPGLTPRVASAALALVTAATEKRHEIIAFGHQMVPVSLSPRQRLDDVLTATDRIPFGATDCALPMRWALKNRVEADAFVIYTDSETWFGNIHPVQALREYREKMGIAAKLVVCGMVANEFTIADPDDGGMLDVVGFDTATPALIADFVR